MGRVEAQFGSIYRRCDCRLRGVPDRRCPHPWCYRVRHRGEEIRRTVGSGVDGRRTALDKLREIQVRLMREGHLGVRTLGRATMAEFRETLAPEVERRCATDASRRAFWRRYTVAASFLSERLSAVTTTRVRDLMTWLSARRTRPGPEGGRVPRPVGPATRNRYLDCLSVTFRAAVERGYAAEDPTAPLKGRAREREPRRRPPAVTRRDFDAIVAREPSEARRVVYRLAYLCGLRRAEALGLSGRDLDLGRRTLRVWGKGRKERILALSAEAAGVLAAWSGARLVPMRGEDLLLADAGSPDEVTRAFAVARTAAGLSRVTLHHLRAAYCTARLEEGASLVRVRDEMGHGSVGVTDRYTPAGGPERAQERAQRRPARRVS